MDRLKRRAGVAAATATLLLSFAAQSAPPPVSYTRQIRPLFERQCLGCHGSGPNAASGYSMTTRELLLRGGRHGTAVVPGKAGAQNSALIHYLTGEKQPRMPSGAPPLDRDTIDLIRRWISEGAKFDAASAAAAVPVPARTKAGLTPAVTPGRSAAPVTALAFAPDGKLLAAGGFRSVRLVDPATGTVTRTLSGPVDQVQAVAFSPDGRWLAAAGGVPGERGEVIVWDIAAGKLLRRFGNAHADVVYGLAWKPNGAAASSEIATASLDKTVRLWNAATGKPGRVLRDHADAVLSVAYSPDGKLLATGSADRSAKLFDSATGKGLAVLAAHGDSVTGVAFNHDGKLLATVSADKTLRVWKVAPGGMGNPERTQNESDTVNACVFSGDGSLLAYGAGSKVVKIFNGDGAQLKRALTEPLADWVHSLAIHRDNRTIAAGTQNGLICLWNADEGKLIRSITLSAPVAAGSRKVEAKKP